MLHPQFRPLQHHRELPDQRLGARRVPLRELRLRLRLCRDPLPAQHQLGSRYWERPQARRPMRPHLCPKAQQVVASTRLLLPARPAPVAR